MNNKVQDPKISKIIENTIEQCCSGKSVYEITYEYVPKTWLVCYECFEFEYFSSSIKKQVRIST